MRNRLALFIGIVATVGTLSALTAQRGTASISGRAVDGVTRQPMAGVEVYARVLASETRGVQFTVLTDLSGSFAFNELAPGAYAIQGVAGSNFSGHVGRTEWQDGDRWIAIGQDERMTGVVLPMWRGPTVAGRVLDDEGRPLANVDVRACPADAPDCPVWNNHTQTDDLGGFALRLDPGQYVIEALWRPLDTWNSGVSGTPRRTGQGGRAETYRPTFHPRGVSRADARRLSLTPGDALTGTDIVLRSAPEFEVSGIVAGVTRAKEFEVHLGYPGASLDCWDDCGRVETDAAGRFRFSRIPPGDYILRAIQEPKLHRREPLDRVLSQPRRYGLVPIRVVDRNLDVRVALAPAPTMTGIVRFEGKPSPFSIGELNERWDYMTFMLHMRWPQYLDGAFLPDGRYTTVGMPPGRYWLEMFPPEGWHVKSVMVGGRDAEDHAIELPEAGLSDAIVTYTSRRASLVGRVLSEPPFERVLAWVTVSTADQSLWGIPGPLGHQQKNGFQTRRVLSQQIDHTGAFDFKLPAGDYFVIATESEMLPLRTAGAYAALAPLATAVTIQDGATVTQNFRVRAVKR